MSKYFLLHSDKMTEEKKLKSEREFAEVNAKQVTPNFLPF